MLAIIHPKVIGAVCEYGIGEISNEGHKIMAHTADGEVGTNPAVVTPNDLPLIATITEFLAENLNPAAGDYPRHMDVLFDVAADTVTVRRLDVDGIKGVGLPTVIDIFVRYGRRNDMGEMELLPAGNNETAIHFGAWAAGLALTIKGPSGILRKTRWEAADLTSPRFCYTGTITAGKDIGEILSVLEAFTNMRRTDHILKQQIYDQQALKILSSAKAIDISVPRVPMNFPGRPGMISLIDGPPRR